MTQGEPVHEINPSETYQLDSSQYDDEERDNLNDDEYDRLVEEAENGFSEEEVQQMTADLKEKGIINFLRNYLTPADEEEPTPSLRKLLLGFGIVPPGPLRAKDITNLALLPFTKIALSRILRRRSKLPRYNTLQDAIDLLRKSRKIMVLSGAGISTSCGIPDFRSANGLYAQLQAEGKWELDDPQQMFDIHFFMEHPEVFYSFAKQIYPSNFVPSPCHRWIKMLEDKGVLLRNYTQNIDTLESLAGVTRVLQCHGSFATASCLRCKTRVPGPTIEPHIMSSSIPFCGPCREQRNLEMESLRIARIKRKSGKSKSKAAIWDDESGDEEVDEWGGGPPGIIKPDITFFGQALESEFDQSLYRDREEVDLLIIIGTSLKVAPVSEVLTHIPHSVPQIFINLTPISHVQPDICLLGDADTIVTYLSRELGWEIPPPAAVPLSPNSEKLDLASSPSALRKPLAAIELDDVEWVSAVGDMSHIHFLRRHQEATIEAAADQKSSAVGRVGDSHSSAKEAIDDSTNDEATADRLGYGEGESPARDGYASDDEGDSRPSKRQRNGH